jgi:hypothetical protein
MNFFSFPGLHKNRNKTIEAYFKKFPLRMQCLVVDEKKFKILFLNGRRTLGPRSFTLKLWSFFMKQTLFEIPAEIHIENADMDFELRHGPNGHYVQVIMSLRGSKRTTVKGHKKMCLGHTISWYDQRIDIVNLIKKYRHNRVTIEEVLLGMNKPGVVLVKEIRTGRCVNYTITLRTINGTPPCALFSLMNLSESDETPRIYSNTALLTQSLFKKERGQSRREVILLTVTSATKGIGFFTSDRRYRSHRGKVRQIRIFRDHQSSPANSARR